MEGIVDGLASGQFDPALASEAPTWLIKKALEPTKHQELHCNAWGDNLNELVHFLQKNPILSLKGLIWSPFQINKKGQHQNLQNVLCNCVCFWLFSWCEVIEVINSIYELHSTTPTETKTLWPLFPWLITMIRTWLITMITTRMSVCNRVPIFPGDGEREDSWQASRFHFSFPSMGLTM